MNPDRIERGTLLLAVAILGFQLFLPPVVGLANNGDFHKVLAWFSLAGPVTDEYKYATQTLTFDPSHYLVFSFNSIDQLLAFASIALNSLVSKSGTYDIRFIGAVHATLYLLTLRLLLPLLRGWSARRRIVFGGLLLLIFADVMYVCQLNSFYMDTPALIFLLLTVVLACRVLRWRRKQDAVAMVVSALCMAASKPQHAPLGFVLAALLAACPRELLPGLGKAGRMAAVTGILAVSALTLESTPWTYRAINLFSQIFYGVLPRAREPGRELAILGLDDSYKRYIGMYAYSEGSPLNDEQFTREFLSKTSYARIGVLLLRRPGRAFDIVVRGLGEVGRQRPLLGNFDRSAGLGASGESQAFSLWSTLKRKVFEGRGTLYLGYTAILPLVFLSLLALQQRHLPAGSLALGVACCVALCGALGIALFGDALDEIRHSWVFLGISDAMLLGIVALI